MTRTSAIAMALGAFFTASSVLPVKAMPTINQPAKITSQAEQVKVVVRYGSWRGHRGYHDQRNGYRRHVDGYWYPRSAFTERVAPVVRVRVGNAHIRWCHDRYMTYRASDNTFVANSGTRRICRSPY